MFQNLFLYLAASSTLATLSASSSILPRHNKVQHIHLPFEARTLAGEVDVTIRTNDDKQNAYGFDILYPGYSESELDANFNGFPVVQGDITYPIPSNGTIGYGSLFGWIQFTRNATDADWAMDLYPFALDIPTPFGYWGVNPSILDAPADPLPLTDPIVNSNVTWRAQAYLAQLVDAGITKNVTVIPGVAIEWGYDIVVPASNTSTRTIVVVEGTKLNTSIEWNARLPFLRESFTEWTFQDA